MYEFELVGDERLTPLDWALLVLLIVVFSGWSAVKALAGLAFKAAQWVLKLTLFAAGVALVLIIFAELVTVLLLALLALALVGLVRLGVSWLADWIGRRFELVFEGWV